MTNSKLKTQNSEKIISNILDMKKNIKKNDIQPNKAKKRFHEVH